MLKGMRFTFAFLLTAILVFVFSFLIGLSISESIFGAAIGTAPILLAVLYYASAGPREKKSTSYALFRPKASSMKYGNSSPS